jgi:hypothetical protein
MEVENCFNFHYRHLTGNGFCSNMYQFANEKIGKSNPFLFHIRTCKNFRSNSGGSLMPSFNAINYPIEFSKSCTKSNQFGNLCIPNTKFMQISSPRFPLGIGPQLNHPKWLSLKIKIFHSGGHYNSQRHRQKSIDVNAENDLCTSAYSIYSIQYTTLLLRHCVLGVHTTHHQHPHLSLARSCLRLTGSDSNNK